jgi:hypothetical protein
MTRNSSDCAWSGRDAIADRDGIATREGAKMNEYDRADADAVLDADAATVGDTIDYDDWADLDDMGRDTIRDRLAARGLGLRDTGDDLEVVWRSARDGSRLDPDRDAVDAQNQPATAVEG